MIKKVVLSASFLIIGIFLYFIFFFNINNYKTELEEIISEKTKTEFSISGDLDLDFGINTKIKAELLSVKKNNILILESDIFVANVSLSQMLQGKIDITSVSLVGSKFYGLNIDESIIQTYSLLSGKKYFMKNARYSSIKSITARGNYSTSSLQIEDIQIHTELLQADGFGEIVPQTESLSISAISTIVNDKTTREKYGENYPAYLENTRVPILISGNFNSPKINVKISDIVDQKIKQEFKNRAIESIKEKIKSKIQSEMNIKPPR
tara:strand:- start:8167 stop:8964 length:798 start_codon:yes stop_codon:yes gene_type:complete